MIMYGSATQKKTKQVQILNARKHLVDGDGLSAGKKSREKKVVRTL